MEDENIQTLTRDEESYSGTLCHAGLSFPVTKMASRFISAGGAELKAPEGLSTVTDDAWAKAKRQVEESKKPVKEGPAPGTQEGGISLFEHLQNQKGKLRRATMIVE